MPLTILALGPPDSSTEANSTNLVWQLNYNACYSKNKKQTQYYYVAGAWRREQIVPFSTVGTGCSDWAKYQIK